MIFLLLKIQNCLFFLHYNLLNGMYVKTTLKLYTRAYIYIYIYIYIRSDMNTSHILKCYICGANESRQVTKALHFAYDLSF